LDFFAVKMLLDYQEQLMIKIEFTTQEIDTLAYERYHYPYHLSIWGNCCYMVVSVRRRDSTAAYSTTDY
jgi:hypothetical protein